MMKSLEIVNVLLEEKENEYYKAFGIFLEREVKGLRKIKQDLEVLEIIKNQHININKLEDILKNEEDIEIALIKYNFEFYGKNEYILTLKEIRKLKQWLEENDNE